jgi:hypothetical protein
VTDNNSTSLAVKESEEENTCDEVRVWVTRNVDGTRVTVLSSLNFVSIKGRDGMNPIVLRSRGDGLNTMEVGSSIATDSDGISGSGGDGLNTMEVGSLIATDSDGISGSGGDGLNTIEVGSSIATDSDGISWSGGDGLTTIEVGSSTVTGSSEIARVRLAGS